MENDFSEKKAALLSLVETLKRALDEDAREEEGYYDGADVKQLLNISDRTLYRWRQQNLVQFVKMGGKFFYPKHTIRQLRSRGKDKRQEITALCPKRSPAQTICAGLSFLPPGRQLTVTAPR